jgi:antirestriction protein ArdC
VQMPPFETFRDAESYAATLADEVTYWIKHERRLARDFERVRHGEDPPAYIGNVFRERPQLRACAMQYFSRHSKNRRRN